MQINTLNNNPKTVMDCDIKDSSGLNDFQKLPNQSGVAIPKVGIERFRVPLTFRHADGSLLNHDSEASMYSYLSGEKTGVNMSRFCSILQEVASDHPVDNDFFAKVLERYRWELRDYDTEAPVDGVYLKLKFNYPLKQPSLRSENWGWQYYQCEMAGMTDKSGKVRMDTTINFEYSSTCPCSLSMAKQYEKDFKEGRTSEGSGVAAAHGQRSLCTLRVTYDVEDNVKIEEIVELLRKALPTETQSLVKRQDEQAFAILNGANPMFVEHATRRLSVVLDTDARILDWEASVEHFESLHSHNAVAYIRKERN